MKGLIKKASLLFVCVILFGSSAAAATIEVPDQAATILEAVELAASGDVILLTTDIVDLGGPITIHDKNLTIMGLSNNERALINSPYLEIYILDVTPTISIDRAKLIIQNIYIDSPYIYRDWYNDAASPIVIHSGTLRMVNCSIHCSIESSGNIELERTNLYGYAARWNFNPPYPNESYDRPALRVKNSENIEIDIRESYIGGDYDEALAVENIPNASIRVSNSILVGGVGAKIRKQIPLPGFAAIAIRSCTDFRLDTNDSIFQGGSGVWSPYIYTSPVPLNGIGGQGLVIDDSIGIVLSGDFRGGNGARGLDYLSLGPPTAGSPGGNGIQLIRSIVEYSDIIAIGGKGGRPSLQDRNDGGPDGIPIVLDEFSIFTEITGIGDWMRY